MVKTDYQRWKKKTEYLLNQGWRLQQPFHLPFSSPWPFFLSFSVFFLIWCSVLSLKLRDNLLFIDILALSFSIIFILFILINWFFDIFDESYRYNHNNKVLQGLQLGIILFIVSEVCLFASFFASFLYVSITPNLFINCIWPPLGIKPANIYSIPLLNSYFLLASGLSLHYAELNIFKKQWLNRKIHISKEIGISNILKEIGIKKKLNLGGWQYRINAIEGFVITLIYGFLFLLLQYYEYNVATFDITDSVYGSLFYLITGFHGLHVIIGLIFIYICIENHGRCFYQASYSNLSLKCAIWYWHFVDTVWIFLFILVYWWGGL